MSGPIDAGGEVLVGDQPDQPDQPGRPDQPFARLRRILARLRPPIWVRRGVGLVVILLVLEYLVLPQIAGARQALHVLSDVRPGYLVLGAVLEIASIVSYGALTQSVLPPKGRPSLWSLTRIDTTSLGVSHVVPGGAATASALRFRLLTEAGVERSAAAFGATVQGVGSAIVLNLLLWLALLISIPLRGVNVLYGFAAGAGAALIAVGVAGVVLLTRGQELAVRVVRTGAGRVPYLTPDTAERLVRNTARQLADFARDRRVLRGAIIWALLNWLLDAAALWVFVAAYGYHLGLDGLIISFGLANVLAALPVTPGGLGIVEGVLVPSLVGFGAPRGIAVLAVVTYRLLNFWLPIPAAAAAYLSLRAETIHAQLPRRFPSGFRRKEHERDDGQNQDGHT